MNVPQLITTENVMTEKPFRLKGCRYHLLYSGHLSKEFYYNWFRQNLMPRRDAQLTLFIANINVNGAQFTKVIFKFNVTIDWKSIEKLDFPIGTGKARPEVRPIYKSNWSTEYMNMVKQDPQTYPPLEDVNVISARSPKRIKGVSVTPKPISTVPAGIVIPLPLGESNTSSSVEPVTPSVSVETAASVVPAIPSAVSAVPAIPSSVSAVPAISSAVPAISSAVSAVPAINFKDKIQDVILEMGILTKLNALEELIKGIAIAGTADARGIAGTAVSVRAAVPTDDKTGKTITFAQDINYGIFIEGDASDIVLTSDMPNIILENKSVISIRQITSETADAKKAIHTTKNSMYTILETLKTYGIWFRKYQDKLVLKNSDLMLITLYINV